MGLWGPGGALFGLVGVGIQVGYHSGDVGFPPAQRSPDTNRTDRPRAIAQFVPDGLHRNLQPLREIRDVVQSVFHSRTSKNRVSIPSYPCSSLYVAILVVLQEQYMYVWGLTG